MLGRFFALAALAAATGCASLPRTLLDPDPRTDVSASQSAVTAKVGDVLYLEVGPATLDPRRDGFRATVNGRMVEKTVWDTQYTTLKYRFRAEEPGAYRVEVYAPYKDGALTRIWDVTVEK